MIDDVEAKQVALAINAFRTPLASWPPPEPGGWEHLPLALVHLAFSSRAPHDGVGEVPGPVRRYAEWAAPRLGRTPDALLAAIEPGPSDAARHTTGEMAALLGPLSSAERVEVFGNRRPASTHPSAPRRADAVVEAAQALADLGVQTRQDFGRRHADPDAWQELQRVWLRVPGFGERSWQTVPILCGLPDVEAEIRVMMFVTAVLDADRLVDPTAARELLAAATEHLRALDPSPRWTVLGVEDFVSRIVSGRPPR